LYKNQKYMFEEILNTVKEHMGNHPDIPAEQQDAIHNEIANHIAGQLANQNQASTAMGNLGGGLLAKVESMATSGSPIVNAVEGGLVATLASKFGLGPAITGAIAASIPGLMQKLSQKSAAN
jgi:hypothetical protein